MIHSRRKSRTAEARAGVSDTRRERFARAVCVLALLVQAVVPFAHSADEGREQPSGQAVSRTATLEDAASPEGASHDASCPLCQILSASRHLVVSRMAPPGLGIEAQDLARPDRARAAACRVDVRSAGPRGPPNAA